MLRVAILHECQNYLGGEGGLGGSEKNRGLGLGVNPSCVCARCALWYESVRFMETSTCQRLVKVCNLD